MSQWRMRFKSLKINIVLHLALLLITGMVVTDIVVTSFARKDLLKARVSKTDLLWFHVKERIRSAETVPEKEKAVAEAIPEIIDTFDIQAAYFATVATGRLFSDEHIAFPDAEPLTEAGLKKQTFAAVDQNRKLTRFSGKTWGVFWEKNKYLVVSYPLEATMGISFVISLETLDDAFFANQKLIGFYIALNTIFLCFIGLLRFSKIIIRPIKRLTNIVKTYDGADDALYMMTPAENEFGTLSFSLHSMINRISEDKEKLEESLTRIKNAQDEIIRAEKMSSIGKISAGVAHEIGNPIGIVLGYLALLKQDNITPGQRADFLNRVEKEIQRIDQIIKRLLNFSQKSGKEQAPHAVHKIIIDTVNMVKVQKVFSRIDLVLKLEAENDVVVCDGDQLKQVFINLILNAVDAILLEKAEKGVITIRTALTEDNTPPFIEIRVTDNGSGIASEDLAKIFDPFYTTKEPGAGTGLGLWVSYMIVADINGSIRAESSPEGGTTFVILLPTDKTDG